MHIIEPTFDVLTPVNAAAGIELLRTIEKLARISHRSEQLQTENSWERFIKFVVMDKGDWSVVEHAAATVIFRVDRGVTHELVRHRLFSFTQESTRFVNYKKKGEMEFIMPAGMDGDASPDHIARTIWKTAMVNAETDYLELVENGRPPQLARSVLPNALASTIAVTGNLRNWRSFFMLRCTLETHPDFRRVVIPLLKVFQDRIPLLFDDLIPNERQSISLSKPR